MATPNYGDLPTLKQMLSISDTARDALLTMALTSASRQIDRMCSRRFYLDTVVSTRTFTPVRRESWYISGGAIQVDDIGSTTGLIVAEGWQNWNASNNPTWTPTSADLTLLPDNALALGLPITALQRTIGTIVDPYVQVQVTALWGWPAVPDEINLATLLQAARLYRRKDSPEGILGNTDFGTMRVAGMDRDVQALCDPYRKAGFA